MMALFSFSSLIGDDFELENWEAKWFYSTICSLQKQIERHWQNNFLKLFNNT